MEYNMENQTLGNRNRSVNWLGPSVTHMSYRVL